MFPHFKFAHISISMYGLMTVVGVIACYCLYYKRIELFQYNKRILNVAIIICLTGMAIGSKLLFIFTQIPNIAKNFSWNLLLDTIITSGFVFYGGLIGAIVSIHTTARLLGIDSKKLSNFMALGFPLFHSFGRIGCFFGGCCYGIPWKYGIAMIESSDIKRVPIQLIESALELCIFFLLFYREKKQMQNSQMTLYVHTYSVIRFFLEFLRGDEIRGVWAFGLSTSQYISILLVIVTTCMIAKERMKKHREGA